MAIIPGYTPEASPDALEAQLSTIAQQVDSLHSLATFAAVTGQKRFGSFAVDHDFNTGRASFTQGVERGEHERMILSQDTQGVWTVDRQVQFFTSDSEGYEPLTRITTSFPIRAGVNRTYTSVKGRHVPGTGFQRSTMPQTSEGDPIDQATCDNILTTLIAVREAIEPSTQRRGAFLARLGSLLRDRRS